MVRSNQQALEILRKHDAAGLYDSLEPWQQRELLCIVRRLVNRAVKLPASQPSAKIIVEPTPG